MADGYILEIPKSVLNELEKADKKIEQLAKTSEITKNLVVKSFNDMAKGINPFLDSLDKANSKMRGLFSKSSESDTGRLSSNISKIAVSLGKVSESPVQNVNNKIASLKELLVDAESAARKLDAQISSIQSGGKGTVSSTVRSEGQAGKQLSVEIQNEIAALERQKQSIVTSNNAWKEYLATINGVSLSSQREKGELDKLNETYRTGTSIIQQRNQMMADAMDKAYRMYDAEIKAEEKKERAQKKQLEREERLARKKEELATKTAQRAADKQVTQAETAYNRAMMSTEGTISQRINKIAKLRHAEQLLIATGKDYSTYLSKIKSDTSRLNSENTRAAKTLEQLRNSQRSVLNTSDQLQRKLALLFSVSAIIGYGQQLINVRKEFELQQRSLQAIIQNKDAANQVWEKTVQLAVRSPFTVKELVTYTKQLAAYRIETEKLYETNKMLADISAGLGVGMDRLILAYGQVKAANYLRGTELRQFSEAGVNILGELAAYFSEIENRAISVGEVFEMVSKRMVSFSDVEEIFKRITSAGGIFYNMQEIQAETLAGQISNLRDSIDLMFNDIGERGDGILKGTVALLRSMVEHWEEVANAILPILAAYGLYKTAIISINAVDKVATAFRAVTNASLQKELVLRQANAAATQVATKAQVGFNLAAKANPYILAASVIIGAVSGLVMYLQRANKAQREFNLTVTEGKNRAYELTSRFKELAATVLDSTKSYSEQNEALKELKRSYRDILPAQSLTIEGLKAMKGNYDAVTAAIYAKINAQTQEKLMESVTNKEGAALNKSTLELQTYLDRIGFTAEEAGLIIAKFRDGIQKGEIVDKNAANRLLEIADGVRKIDRFEFTGTWSRLGSIWTDESETFFNNVVKFQKRLEDIQALNIGPDEDYKISPLWKKLKKELDKESEEINQWEKDNEGKLNPYELDKQSRDRAVKSYQELSNRIKDNIKKGLYSDKDLQIVNKFLQDIQNKVNEINGSPLTQKSRSILEEVFKANNAPLEEALKYLKTDEKSWEALAEEVKKRIDALKLNQAQYEIGLTTYTKEDIEKQQRLLKALEDYYERIHVEAEKSGGKGESEANKQLKQQISLLKEVGRQYNENLKLYGKEEALSKTRQDYAPAFDAAGFEQGFLLSMDLDAAGIISGLESLFETASEEGRAILQRAISGLKGDLEIRVRTENLERTKNEIESLFQNYELSIELDKLGLDKNLMGQLFNIDTTSIDDIKRRLESIFPDLSQLSEEQLKIYKDASKKIADMEKKELEERLKTYSQYLRKSMSERVAIELEGQKRISEIPQEFTPTQRDEIKKNIRKETQQKRNELDLKEFKESDVYIKIFQDLDSVSSSVLRNMKEKLEGMRASMSDLEPEQVKYLAEQLQKVQDQLDSRNPFKELIPNIKKYIAYLKDKKRLDSELSETQSKINNAEDIRKDQVALLGIAVDDLEVSRNKVGVTEEEIRAKEHLVAIYSDNVKQIEDELSGLNKTKTSILEQIANADTLRDKLKLAFSTAAQYAQEVESGIHDFASGMENIFGTMDDKMRDSMETAAELINGVSNLAQGAARIAAQDYIGGGIQVAVGLATTLGALFNIGDKKKERAIQQVIDKVEKLGKAYEKLEEAMQDAYAFDDLTAYNNQMEANLKAQNESLRQAISAEQAKKKTDNARIQEWLDQIEENNKLIEENRKRLIEEMGGFGTEANIKSAADGFVSAWLDAFNETGDGLKGLEENFDEWVQQMAQKQLLGNLFNKYMDSSMKQFDKMFEADSEGGGTVTKREYDAWAKLYKEKSAEFNEAAKAYMEAMGIEPTANKNAELSGLQQGIQQVSESTAQALEALLNSMRFFVSDSNLELKSIRSLLGGDIEGNPMLAELRMQTQIIKSINNLFSSVVRPGHPNGGFGINAFI